MWLFLAMMVIVSVGFIKSYRGSVFYFEGVRPDVLINDV